MAKEIEEVGRGKAEIMSDARRLFMEELGAVVIEAIRDQPFDVEGTPSAYIKLADGTYRTKPLTAGSDFFLSYAYVGKRNDLIFGLAPADSQEFEFAEMTPQKLDDAFPFIGSAIATAFDLRGESVPELLVQLEVKLNERKDKETLEAIDNYKKLPHFNLF